MLGYLAGTLTTTALVPQVWRTFRTKDVSGISLRMYSIFTTGIAVWLAYGIFLKETPMMVANGVSLVLACAVLVMKLRYRNNAEPAGERMAGAGRAARCARNRTARRARRCQTGHPAGATVRAWILAGIPPAAPRRRRRPHPKPAPCSRPAGAPVPMNAGSPPRMATPPCWYRWKPGTRCATGTVSPGHA